MMPSTLFWLAGAGLAVSCLAAIQRRSLAEFSRHELEVLCRRRNTLEMLGQVLREHEQVALSAEIAQMLGAALFVAILACGVRLEPFSAGAPGWAIVLLTAVVGALALVIAGIWIPWGVSRVWATRFVFFTWPLWRGFHLAATPLVFGARLVDRGLHRLAGRQPDVPNEEAFEEEIRTIVSEGHREGLLEEEAREMIEGVIELGDVEVSEIMTPRTDMVCIPVTLSWQEMLDFVVRAGHTRIPVYEKNRDDIVGILYTKDLLPELAKTAKEPQVPLTSLLRQPSFVPETKPVDVLLQEFQQSRTHLVMVLDEYGGVSGLVTMEDVLEEIVGEIVDEYDKDLVEGIRQLDDHTAEVLGRVHVDEVNERLQLALPEEADYDTIGGFVFAELGHIPAAGEQLLWNNLRITVLEATRRRIERLRIEILQGAEQN